MNRNQQKEIKHLYQTFPTISTRYISDVYYEKKGNMDAIVDTLLKVIEDYTIKDDLLINEPSSVEVQTFLPSISDSYNDEKNPIESNNKKKSKNINNSHLEKKENNLLTIQ